MKERSAKGDMEKNVLVGWLFRGVIVASLTPPPRNASITCCCCLLAARSCLLLPVGRGDNAIGAYGNWEWALAIFCPVFGNERMDVQSILTLLLIDFHANW